MSQQQPWVSSDASTLDARRTLLAIVELCQEDLPFAASVGQLGLQSRSFHELQQHLVSIYLLALEASHPFLPDLVDQLLCWIEAVAPEGGSLNGQLRD